MFFIFHAQKCVDYHMSDLVLSYVILSADVITTILKVQLNLFLTRYGMNSTSLGRRGQGLQLNEPWALLGQHCLLELLRQHHGGGHPLHTHPETPRPAIIIGL